MDLKKKLSEYGEKAKQLWTTLRTKCGPALEKAKEFWNKAKVWLGKARVWILHSVEFLKEKAKWLAGHAAVLALKIRKWVRKNTAGLRSWWAHWKGRKWLADRMAAIKGRLNDLREKRPAPRKQVQADPEPAAIAEPVCTEVPVIQTAAEPAPQPVEPEAPAAIPRKPLFDPDSVPGKIWAVLAVIGKAIKSTCIWIFRLRRFIMAAPVVYFALKLAFLNAKRLPEMVGMDIQASGEFARMVSRSSAVLGPLALTGFCLVLLFCSKKTLLPWMISLFTLILPVLIWMTNYYA